MGHRKASSPVLGTERAALQPMDLADPRAGFPACPNGEPAQHIHHTTPWVASNRTLSCVRRSAGGRGFGGGRTGFDISAARECAQPAIG